MNTTYVQMRNRDEHDVLSMINQHPLHAVEIANRLNIQVGAVNNAVLALRSRGYLICGDDACEGYYFGCLAEVEKTVENLEDQIRMLEVAIRLMNSSVSHKEAQTPGQMSLDI